MSLGMCSEAKDRVTLCLRAERLKRTAAKPRGRPRQPPEDPQGLGRDRRQLVITVPLPLPPAPAPILSLIPATLGLPAESPRISE